MAEGKFIKSGTSDGAVLRARDVEFMLKDTDTDPRLKNVLCRLAEIEHFNTKGIAELSVLVDQLITNQQSFANVAGEMKTQTDRFNTFLGEADVEDAPPREAN